MNRCIENPRTEAASQALRTKSFCMVASRDSTNPLALTPCQAISFESTFSKTLACQMALQWHQTSTISAACQRPTSRCPMAPRSGLAQCARARARTFTARQRYQHRYQALPSAHPPLIERYQYRYQALPSAHPPLIERYQHRYQALPSAHPPLIERYQYRYQALPSLNPKP